MGLTYSRGSDLCYPVFQKPARRTLSTLFGPLHLFQHAIEAQLSHHISILPSYALEKATSERMAQHWKASETYTVFIPLLT